VDHSHTAPSALPPCGDDHLHFEVGALVDRDGAVWVQLADGEPLPFDAWLTAHETANRTLVRMERLVDRFRFVFRVCKAPPAGGAR